MKQPEFEFCMTQFKTAIAVLGVFILIVLYWAVSTCNFERMNRKRIMTLAAAAAPMASNITLNAKAPHKYWGNCNKCHVTTNIPKKPVSQVFQGPPISVDAPLPHKDWGNCNKCHKVIGGVRLAAATGSAAPPIVANAKPTHPDFGDCVNCHQILKPGKNAAPVAFATLSSSSLGLELQNVNSAVMGKWGLSDEEGVLVLSVRPGSLAENAGFKKGDEIIRLNDVRMDTINDIDFQLSRIKRDNTLKIAIYRGRRSKNIYMEPLADGVLAAAQINAQAPMTQNRIETLAERFNVPKTQAAVRKALNQAQAARPVAMPNSGKVIVAAQGPGLYSATALSFDNSPYFFLYDPVANSYKSIVNPNYTDVRGNSRQNSHLMVDLGASNVIAGSFSPESSNTMKQLRLNLYSGVTGSVKDVINMYRAGRIQPANLNATKQGMIPIPPPPSGWNAGAVNNRGIVF